MVPSEIVRSEDDFSEIVRQGDEIVLKRDDRCLRVYRSLQHFGEFNGRRAEPECLARTLVEFPSDLIEVRLGVAR